MVSALCVFDLFPSALLCCAAAAAALLAADSAPVSTVAATGTPTLSPCTWMLSALATCCAAT